MKKRLKNDKYLDKINKRVFFMSILRRKAFYLGFRFFYYPKLIINVTKKLSAANWVGRPLYKNVSCDGIEKYKTPLGDENSGLL